MMPNIATSTGALAPAREAAERLASGLGERLLGVALFGSRARTGGREGNDWDLLVIARDLPGDFDGRYGLLREATAGIRGPLQFYAWTQEEFEGPRFPPSFLDIGLDGIVLFEQGDYLTRRLARIRGIIEEARLVRLPNLIWTWRDRKPPPGKWAVDWEGYREFA